MRGKLLKERIFIIFLDDDDWLLPGASLLMIVSNKRKLANRSHPNADDWLLGALQSFWKLAHGHPGLYGGIRVVDEQRSLPGRVEFED
jgi:hypothetical protein